MLYFNKHTHCCIDLDSIFLASYFLNAHMPFMFNKLGTVENVISSLARREYFISIGRKTMESENLTVFMV